MALKRAAAPILGALGEITAIRLQQGAAAAQAVQQQARRCAHNDGISVDVPNGNVDRAFRNLLRKLKDESYLDTAQAQHVFVKPSKLRTDAASAKKQRLQREEFNEMLKFIHKRRRRGV